MDVEFIKHGWHVDNVTLQVRRSVQNWQLMFKTTGLKSRKL